MIDPAMFGIAGAFAFATGANDGGTLLSIGLKIPGRPRLLAASIGLTAFVVFGPLLFGTRVAETLTQRLVTSQAPGSRVALMLGIVAAVAVVAALTSLGLPTSLTLALIGGILGGGLGYGLPISWPAAIHVLLVGLAAPFVGALFGYLVQRASRLSPPRGSATQAISRLHQMAFVLLCLAYSVNDGQKMLAVLALAAGTSASVGLVSMTSVLVIGTLFFLGAVFGLPRIAGPLNDGVLSMRPNHAVAAQFSAGIAVLGSSAIGVPVSMTQALAGGLIGSGVSRGAHRVRWGVVGRIGLAWVFTLPASFGLAAAAAFLCKVVTS